MAELSGVTSVITGTLAPSAGVVIFGISTGLDATCLLTGLFGGAVALSHSPKMLPWQRLISLPNAALTAGYLAPWLTEFVISSMNIAEDKGVKLIPFVSFAVGFSAHTIILPALHKLSKKLISERVE